MRIIIVIRVVVAALLIIVGASTETAIVEAQTRVELRCGWFSNPTPANAWLIDRDGEWTIGIQGGYQAEGDWPSTGKWVETNVHYGYGCTCMRATVDRKENKVIKIVSSYGKSLAACRKDPALKKKEPR